MATGRRTRHSKYLVFIDTNIYLNFYRAREKSFETSMLRYIDQNHELIITTDQILMEFKKNRQNVILDSLEKIKIPNWNDTVIPTFLSDAKAVQLIRNHQKEIKQRLNVLSKRGGKNFSKPNSL
jgi:hypothetical protein